MKFTTKKFGSIATAAVLAGTMAFMPATAFATVSFNDDASSTVAATTVLNKEWDAASKTQFNNDEVFTYDVTFKDAQPVGSWTPDTLSTETQKINLHSNWADNATSDLKSTASLTAKQLLGGYTFTNPGVYNFTVSEENTHNPNISYDTDSYTVTVVVTMPTDYPTHTDPVIESVGVKKTDGTGKTTANFTNTYAANDSLTVSKTVSGTAAKTTDEFTYTLSLNGVKGSYNYTKTGGALQKAETGTIKDGDTFTLTHGQQIVIENLPEGASYTVKETDTAYDESNTVDGTASTKDGHEATGTIKKGGDEVAFKNTRGFATGTGITMNTLPFVVVATVAVAGGAALVISRRRHAGEDF